MRSLNGKSALITGGSRGIGKAIARRFHEEGARVAITYLKNEKGALELQHECPGLMVEKCDVSNVESVTQAMGKLAEEMGSMDIVVNNAGIMLNMPFEEFDDVTYDRIMDTNLRGPMHIIKEALPLLKRSQGGSIINISSNAGIGTAIPGTTLYAISKAALIMLTKRLSLEFAHYGIRVNAIAPGWVETDLTTAGRSVEDVGNQKRYFKEHSTVGRVGNVDDIAAAALFLASSASSFVNGQVLVVDGGRTDNLSHSV